MRKSSFFGDITGVISSNAFAEALRFIIGILLARALAPEGRGLYAAILVVPMMIVSLTELGIRRSVIQHIGEKKYELKQLMGVLSILFSLSTILGIIACYLVYISIGMEGMTQIMMLIVLLNIPFNILLKFSRGVFTGKEIYRQSNLLNWMPIFLQVLFLLLFLLIVPLSVTGALLALLLSNLFLSFYALGKINKINPIRLKWDSRVSRELLQLGLIYAIALFLVRLNFRVDILLLQLLSDSEQTGLYVVGSNFAEKWQVPLTIGGVIISKSAHYKQDTQLNRDINILIRNVLYGGIVLSVLVFFLSPYLIRLLYGNDYSNSIMITKTILPAILLLAVGRIMSTRLAGLKKTLLVIWVYLPALLINIALNLVFIPKYGAMGAVYSTNISYFLASVAIGMIYLYQTNSRLKDIVHYRKSDFFSLFDKTT